MRGEGKGSPDVTVAASASAARKVGAPAEHRKVVTVLHADLSGSTPLAERLDPEELRGIIATFFNALAQELRRFGGSIDKYIGDAVRAVFEGPISVEDDVLRGVAAALAMQQAIARENEELERRYGVRLSLRIGVSTGEVVPGPGGGDGESTEAMVGEAVTVAQRLEGAAVLNTVLVSAATQRFAERWFEFEAVPPVPRKDREGHITAFRVLARKERAGLPGEAASPAATARRRSASLQVVEEKAHALEEQRKVVTVLFADLAAPLPERLRPEEVRDVLAAYFGTLAREIRRYGGTIDKFIGDAVMAVFGAPISHEDDATRAVHAALAIRREIMKQNEILERDFGVRLSTRIGVNTGEVVAGLLPGEVLAYTITGDAVNTAQRLESAAHADEILVGEGTHVLGRHAFVFQRVPPLTLKGKAEPVPAYRVVAVERRASPRGGVALVGRQEDLRRLFGLLREASAGRGQVVHLWGEAGVGKTRLVSEFLASAGDGVDRLRARASSYETTTAYALVADLIRRTFHVQREEEEANAREALTAGFAPLAFAGRGAVDLLLEVLGYPLQSSLPPERKRELLIALLNAYLRHRSEARPVVVAVEDVHWIDSASTAVFREMIAAVPLLHCLFLTTGREEASVPWRFTMMPLQPLESSLASEMVNRVTETPLDEKVRGLVLERTGGNPFFIEEVVRALATGRTATVPVTVRDLLESKVDALDASPKHVAQRAAVIGRTFWTRVLAQVAPGEPLEPALATLESERFVAPYETVPEPKYIFRHALLQEVLYETQLLAQRRTAHAQVGGAIEELFQERVDEYVNILAFHYDRSDLDDKALFWLSRAGDRAKSLFANDEAIALYQSALKRARDGEGALDAGNLLERVSDVQRIAARYDDAIASCERARERIPSPSATTLARLQRKVGLALRMKGAYADALGAYAEGLHALGDEADVEAAWLWVYAGDTHWRRGDYSSARGAIEKALPIAERLADKEVLAECLNLLGLIAWSSGDLPGAARFFDGCLTVVAQLGDAWKTAILKGNLGILYRRIGRYNEALELHRAALAVREGMGSPWALGNSYHNIGSVHRSRGELAEAIVALERSLEYWRPMRYTAGVANSLMLLGGTRVAIGDVARGRAEVLEAEALFASLDSKANLPELYRYLSSAALAAGELEAAQRYADRSLAIARELRARQHEAATQRVLGEIHLARGEVASAREVLGASQRTLAELGEVDELRQTEAVLARLPPA